LEALFCSNFFAGRLEAHLSTIASEAG